MKTTFKILALSAIIFSSPNGFAAQKACRTFLEEGPIPQRLVEMAKKSPSGLLPKNRIVRDPVEIGRNGLYLVNPSNANWIMSSPANFKIQQKAQTKESLEGYMNIQGRFGNDESKPLFIKLDHTIKDENVRNMASNLTGIRMRVSSSNPDQIHKLVLGFRLDSKTKIEIQFKAPKEPTDIFLPIPRSAAEALTEPDGGYPFGAHDYVFFTWAKNAGKKFDLQIFGPIDFERDLFSRRTVARDFVRDVFANVRGRGYWMHLSVEKTKELLDKAISNLSNRKLLEEAIVATPESIQQSIQLIGIKRRIEFREKVSFREFFNGELNFKTSGLRRTPGVPIERGEFALEHGSDAHGRQLYVMTRGMSLEDQKSFVSDIYGIFFGIDVAHWMSWDIMFDAPGDSTPASPLWWRKQRELRGLSVDE